MNLFSNMRWGLWLLMVLAGGPVRMEAQGFFLTVTNYTATNRVYVSSPVTSYITVSNQTGVALAYLTISNIFSEPVTILGSTNDYVQNYNGNYNTNVTTSGTGDVLTFEFVDFPVDGFVDIALTWAPQDTGALSYTVQAASPDVAAVTNYVLNIREVYAAQADLGVSLAVVSPAYITNNFWAITHDWVTYAVTVTNLGPGTATGVVVNNTLSTNLVFPAGQPLASNLTFNVGTLSNGMSAVYQFTVQPTNAGAFTLTANVSAPGNFDPNFANNQSTVNLFVTNYLAALAAGTNSGQSLNYQNGLLEQTVVVANPGAGAAPAVRVVVTGLTNQLYNASGTNNGSPFVVYPAPLAANGRVQLRLQYPLRNAFAFTNGQLQAYAVPASVLNYTPLPATGENTNLNFSRIVKSSDGDLLLEFPATNGRSYTVVYSDNVLFSNAMIALPVVVAPASRVQWLDYGPPATLSAPTNSSRRFYRVYLNP
jgi:uncharacterized repeat protein (TIGR01451 family)